MCTNRRKCVGFGLSMTALFFTLSSTSAAPIKIMPLGDSITRGVGGSGATFDGYRDDLDALLSAEEVDFDFVGSLSDGAGFDSDHEGHGGLRADQILNEIDAYLSANHPDLVILHIGTNDISSDQTPESTANEISSILDAVHSFDKNIKIILASLAPRTDGKDNNTNSLNSLLETLVQTKASGGYRVFYAPMNEIYKCNPTWAAQYLSADDIHPNDAGYNVMAQVWLNTVTTALNATTSVRVTDNFERSQLGITWDADPEIVIDGGDLANSATTGATKWQYMATFKGVRNPTSVALRWSTSSNSEGINDGGLALLLDSPTKDASGYLAWITTTDNMLRLWTITNGNADNDLNLEVASAAPLPGPGDNLRVNFSRVQNDLEFEYFVDDHFAGKIVLANQAPPDEWHAGVILRHDRRNDLARFFAQSGGDENPPAEIQNLTATTSTATSATLTWTAVGNNGQSGRADSYDLRFSTNEILDDSDFQNAAPASGLPVPLPAGSPETFVALDLQPATTYYFAVRVFDGSGNASPVSNTVSIATKAGTLLVDDFNRSELGSAWLAAAPIQIVNNEIADTSSNQSVWDLAVLKSLVNPNEVSFRWSAASDSVGIDQVGIAVMLDAPALNANGYLITRRTLQNQIRLWKIVNGQNPSEPIIQTPLQAKPEPGQEFRIAISSDAGGNRFKVFVNGRDDVTMTDPTFFVNPATVAETYCGVMLAGGRNNMVDNFKVISGQTPVSVSDDDPALPLDFILSQNYPNPFNAQTRIQYELPAASAVRLEVYNLMGQLVKTLLDGEQPAGRYSITWDGSTDSGIAAAASGYYLVRMRAGDVVAVRKMILLK